MIPIQPLWTNSVQLVDLGKGTLWRKKQFLVKTQNNRFGSFFLFCSMIAESFTYIFSEFEAELSKIRTQQHHEVDYFLFFFSCRTSVYGVAYAGIKLNFVT